MLCNLLEREKRNKYGKEKKKELNFPWGLLHLDGPHYHNDEEWDLDLQKRHSANIALFLNAKKSKEKKKKKQTPNCGLVQH